MTALRLSRPFLTAAAAFVAVLLPLVSFATAQPSDRGLLWRVVQVCVANVHLTGASFPCLDVNLSKGVEAGYAVLRAPLETSHIIVTPTVRTTGVESDALQNPDAPNYFKAAWEARHFVAERVPRGLHRDEFALAVNSRGGRSQDQLHIHVDCLQPDAHDALRTHASDLRADRWSRLPFKLHDEHYWGLRLNGEDLGSVNIFKLVSEGLHIRDEDRARLTIVVAGASFKEGTSGFYVLAALAGQRRQNVGHGEFLMDHACSASS